MQSFVMPQHLLCLVIGPSFASDIPRAACLCSYLADVLLNVLGFIQYDGSDAHEVLATQVDCTPAGVQSVEIELGVEVSVH